MDSTTFKFRPLLQRVGRDCVGTKAFYRVQILLSFDCVKNKLGQFWGKTVCFFIYDKAISIFPTYFV